MDITPLNTALVQGSAVTLQCSVISSYPYVYWYKSLCLTTNGDFYYCRDDDVIYYRFRIRSAFRSRFKVTVEINDTYLKADLNIYSTQLADAGVYLCAENRHHFSSTQLIVLGNLIVTFLTRYSHAVRRLCHDVLSVRLSVC